MKTTFNVGDRVSLIENDEHGEVIKTRLDDNGVPLIDVRLDSDQVWVTRQFELREEA
jgi:hypothetical protein